MTLAAGGSGGGLGFLIVILLILAAVGIFYAMLGSVRRMRSNVTRGQFGDEQPPGPPPEQPLDGEARPPGPENDRH